MNDLSMFQLFAQSGSEPLPVGTAIAMVVFCGGIAVTSLAGLFASNAKLESMSSVIGTKNPLTARIVCGVGALFGIAGVVISLVSVIFRI